MLVYSYIPQPGAQLLSQEMLASLDPFSAEFPFTRTNSYYFTLPALSHRGRTEADGITCCCSNTGRTQNLHQHGFFFFLL